MIKLLLKEKRETEKSPDPDDFTDEFLVTFKDDLVCVLTNSSKE